MNGVVKDEQRNIVNQDGLEMTNYKQDVIVNTVDQDWIALADLEFNLSGVSYDQSLSTNDLGVVDFNQLGPGTYTLSETVIPNGYLGLDKPLSNKIEVEQVGHPTAMTLEIAKESFG